MINEIKQAIEQRIHELYPSAAIYVEDVPQNFKTPSFLITVIEQSYNKRLDNKYNSTVSFDVAYFSDKGKNEVKSDCQAVQVNLLRAFDLMGEFRAMGGFRAQSLQATIVDNVLHITFNVGYSEIRKEEFPKIQEFTSNTNIKE